MEYIVIVLFEPMILLKHWSREPDFLKVLLSTTTKEQLLVHTVFNYSDIQNIMQYWDFICTLRIAKLLYHIPMSCERIIPTLSLKLLDGVSIASNPCFDDTRVFPLNGSRYRDSHHRDSYRSGHTTRKTVKHCQIGQSEGRKLGLIK